MSHPDLGQGTQGTASEENSAAAHPKQDRPIGPEMGVQPGNGTQQIMANQGTNTHMMKQGPGPSPVPQHPGASPQQQLSTPPQQGGPIPGIHFSSVPTTSQSSRPKTPNRASPRPYHHPLTPTNRPPSTEPSEINLSPERLNASIAGLFPPKINIPLPPRQPNLNRGFDQQGLNPTTLKAIGQAPPSLTLAGNNNNGSTGGNNTNNSQQPFSAGTGSSGTGAKQDKQHGGQGKRASPSNSRRSSPGSSRKSATPSPGRQKGTKTTITCPPHQQQLVNPQGQPMMLTPTSVPPSPVSVPSQVSGGMETQQTQSPFHGIQSNPAEGVRESQGIVTAEQRQMTQPQSQPQPLRELSAPRMTSPRFQTPQKPKPESEQQTDTLDKQPTEAAPIQDSEVSAALRAAPTSLNQLLDNTGIPNMPRPIQSNPFRDVVVKDSPKSILDADRPLHSNPQSVDVSASVPNTGTLNESEAKPKLAVPIPTSSPNLHPVSFPNSHTATKVNSNMTPILNQNPNSSLSVNPSANLNPAATLCNTLSTNTNTASSVSPNQVPCGQQGNTSASAVSTSSNSSSALNPSSSSLKPSPSPKPVTSVHSVIQLPSSSSTISPNQITVFVTSNPVTSNPITSATTSQVPTSMVSTMVAVPNKNVRSQDIRQQTPVSRPPQFITTTPVFINPIFQVPGASVAPNTTVVSQSVTMVGSIQVSTTNIHLSPAPSSTQSSGVNMTNTQLTRSAVGQVHIATGMSSSSPVGTLPPLQQINAGSLKTESLGEAGATQKTGPLVQQPSPHTSPSVSSPFQPPLASPPPCSSPGAVNTLRKSSISPSPTSQLKSKPAQATAVVSGIIESQQSPVERHAQGSAVNVPVQVFHPPATPAIQTEILVPRTTAAANNITPAVSSPIPIPGQVPLSSQIVTHAPVPVPASVSSPAQTSQASVVTGLGTTISSPTLLSTVTPVQSSVQSPVPSVVPIVSPPGPVQEVSSTTSSAVSKPSGIPPAQPEPPVKEPPATTPVQTTPTMPGKHTNVM